MFRGKNILWSLLLIGDIFLIYLSLFAALVLRYRNFSFESQEQLGQLFYQFSILAPLWFLLLFVFDFYEIKSQNYKSELWRNFIGLMAGILFSGVIYFYFRPQTGIAPKTILILDGAIFSLLVVFWRSFFLKMAGIKNDQEPAKQLHIESLEENIFLEEAKKQDKIYQLTKSALDIFFALLGLGFLMILFLPIALGIKISSSGPIFYSQKRVGKDGKLFTLYKFRSMIKDAEKEGPRWAVEKDERVTAVGYVLRRLHLDELPQAINILKGEISLVGPRPERPEFTSFLNKEIPHYSLREIIRPGIFGWAQLNYPYGDSVEDAKEKLKYDLYYIKNRSLFLDAIIILKSVKIILFARGQ